jgi:O-antigen/teichoic acid export membrane protein
MSNATKHSVFLIITYLLTSGLNYVFGVILSWFFTPSQFGVLGVTQSLLLLLALVVGSGFAWTAAQDMARGGVNDENRHRFRSAWLMNLITGLIVGGGIWMAYSLDILKLGPAYRSIIPLVSLTTVLLAVRAVTNGVMRGIYHFGPLSANLLLEVIIKIAVGVSLVALGWGVLGVMLGFVVGAGISLIHSLLVVRPVKLWKGSGWIDRSVLATTLPLFIGMLGTALMLNLDVLGLKLLTVDGRGDFLSGYYQAAVIVARVPVFLAQALTLVLFSYAAGAVVFHEQEGRTRLSVYFLSAFRSWYRFLLPIGLVLILTPADILHLMFPPQYQESSNILRIAAIGGLLLSLVTMLNGVLQATGHKRGAALSTAIATACQVGVLLWLVPVYGAIGAAISLVAAGTIALTGMIVIYIRSADIDIKAFVSSEKWRSLWREAVPILIVSAILLFLPTGNRFLILFKLAMVVIFYLFVLFALQNNREESQREPSNPLMSLIQLVIGG